MTSPILTQVECERIMHLGGIRRAETMMNAAEDKGRAITNTYAREIMDEFVIPTYQKVLAACKGKEAGKRHAHTLLLADLDLEAVAALSVRMAINAIMQAGGIGKHRDVAMAIGTTIHNELILAAFSELYPDLYYTLSRDFGRRMSKDEKHRVTVLKLQARNRGLYLPDWGVGARDQVGMFMLGLLEDVGLVSIEAPIYAKGKQEQRQVSMTPEVVARIEEVKHFTSLTMPVYGPCVEPPLDWTTPDNGGFHTPELRRMNPTLVRHRLCRSDWFRKADMPVVLRAANTLQRTAWKVNTKILDLALEVAKTHSVGEVLSTSDAPKPLPPAFLATGEYAAIPKDQWPEDKRRDFVAWKRECSAWYTKRKLDATKFGRFYAATRAAEMFRHNSAIYFVYFADSRGRFYPMTYGLNPQGGDLQKALIHFSRGMTLDTEDAVMWFHVQGANKWGYDKATLTERFQWVRDRHDLIMSFAEDPINNRGWEDADCPMQFMAWVMEYQEWYYSPKTFESRVAVSMDGSCNGLQNLSALFRDEIGGRATNLVPSDKMQDIYGQVAIKAFQRLSKHNYDTEEETELKRMWIEHGINRSVVKRAVMTTPYGVTRRSAQDYVVTDYLSEGKISTLDRKQYNAAARVLMDHAWPAIGDVVVKGRLAMDWLHKSAGTIIRQTADDPDRVVKWISPSGFPALQSYYDIEVHRIRTHLHGPCKIRVWTEIDDPDIPKHKNGLAPNFVHSCDAAHLHLTTARCADAGITDLAMIHDDYGTHAANANKLYHFIRQEFVKMYTEHDPIAEFCARYPFLEQPPAKGSLDINQVLESPYFFT